MTKDISEFLIHLEETLYKRIKENKFNVNNFIIGRMDKSKEQKELLNELEKALYERASEFGLETKWIIELKGNEPMKQYDFIPDSLPPDEPMTKEGEQQVHLLAQKFVNDKFKTQMKKGEDKYGRLLETFNGRNTYNDFLAESVDQLAYVTQMYFEYLRLKELIFQWLDTGKMPELPDNLREEYNESRFTFKSKDAERIGKKIIEGMDKGLREVYVVDKR